MNNHGITAENLLAVLPPVLAGDEHIQALAVGIAEVLAARPSEIDQLLIYPNIDALPEELLDILAQDFKVDWWNADYTLSEKRATLKSSWQVHRRLGTPAAVIEAISSIYPNTHLMEWWDYGGEPYHFKLLLDATYEGVDTAKHTKVLAGVGYYKNLRSVLDGVEYFGSGQSVVLYAGTTVAGVAACDSVALTINKGV